MRKLWIPDRDFSDAPTICEMMESDAFVRLTVGPFGSGKSFGYCNELMRRAIEQEPWAHDNVRYSRWAIVRNTFVELKTTTIKTWQICFPPEHCGPMVMSSPPTHRIRYPAVGATPGLDAEFVFLALDKPQDIRKLLSIEFTGVFFNEMRDQPRSIVDAIRGRLGRYPGSERGPTTWSGIMGDTNPPDEEHYIREWELDPPYGFEIYHQPPAVLEVEINLDGKPVCKEPEYRGYVFDHHPWEPERPMPVLTSAGRLWVVNPWAENLRNLKAVAPREDVFGPDGYYGRQLFGVTLAHIRVYVQGRYGFIQDGKPVIPEFLPEMMVRDIPLLKDRPIKLGLDIGGGTLNPAATWFQRAPRGNWVVQQELICNDTGVERFCDEVIRTHRELAGDLPIEKAWGDPAGAKKDEVYEEIIFEHLRRRGIPVQPAPSQATQARIDAIKGPCCRFIDGKPGLIIHPRCKRLIKGLSGGWQFKRKQVSGPTEQYQDQPTKDHVYSDVCESLGYGLLSEGEYRTMTQRTQSDKSWDGHKQAGDFTVW